MDKKFLLKFALRNLWAHPLRSLLTLAGIIIGIAAIGFLVAFAFGMERLVTQEVTHGDAFTLIDVGSGSSLVANLSMQSIEEIQKIPGVKRVEVIINGGAKAKNEPNSQTDVAFYGTSSAYFSWIGAKTKWGKVFADQPDQHQIVVNTTYLKFLGNKEPDQYLGSKQKFDIIIPKALTTADESITVPDQEFSIVGIIQDDRTPYVYVYQDDLIKIGAVKYSQAKVEVNDRNQVLTIRKQIENLGFKTQYVGDTINQINEIFNIFKIMLGSFGLVALIVASIGMFNTLTISLLERTKEIALMKILGMKKKDIRNIFLTEALIFGLIGGLLGLTFSFVLSQISNSILNHFAVQAGGDSVKLYFYPIWFIAVIIFFALLIGFLTGFYPARRATKLDALDVLRYE